MLKKSEMSENSLKYHESKIIHVQKNKCHITGKKSQNFKTIK